MSEVKRNKIAYAVLFILNFIIRNDSAAFLSYLLQAIVAILNMSLVLHKEALLFLV